MTLLWNEFRRKAAVSLCRVILADGEDVRAVQAAAHLTREKIAIPVLAGRLSLIETLWEKQGMARDELHCLDGSLFSSEKKEEWARQLMECRKFNKLSLDEAKTALSDSLILGCLALKRCEAEGFVGGATRTTVDTLRAALPIIGLTPHSPTLFGLFFLESHPVGNETPRTVLLADCAVVPDPSAKQLSQIAVGAAEAWTFFMARQPKVAFLSFSTLGNADYESVRKVREALRLAREDAPTLIFEGEWQADAALDSFSAQIKGAGRSSIAGEANVLIVPDLNCGNIAYKLVQRLGGCRAVGPILWGMKQPVNDLSRGCSAEDIIDAAALTALQAQAKTHSTAGVTII
jgi:phosphate acetyltransferase